MSDKFIQVGFIAAICCLWFLSVFIGLGLLYSSLWFLFVVIPYWIFVCCFFCGLCIDIISRWND